MALNFKTGVVAASGSTGNQSVTGFGFQPKVMRFMLVRLTTDTDGNPGHVSFGITDFTNSRCVALGVDDNVATTNSAADTSTNVLKGLSDGTPTTDGIWDTITAGVDGFTIHCSSAPSSTWQIHYEAWGGSDIANVEVGTWNPTSGTGTKTKTGMSFQPDVLMWLCSTIGTGSTVGTADFGIGATTGSGSDYGVSGDAQDARTVTPDARYWHKASSILLQSGGTAVQDATLTTFNSDGWTYSFATRFSTAAGMFYLAIKGGHWKSGSETTPTTATTKATTGAGFAPTGVVYYGVFQASNSAIQTGNAYMSFGASSAANTSRGVGVSWSNAINQRSLASYAAKAIRNVSASTGTLQHEADTASLDSDGFTLNHTTTQAAAHEFGYLAFATAVTVYTSTLSASALTTGLSPKTVQKTLHD